jgi:NAD(P)H-dependent FMN reductase
MTKLYIPVIAGTTREQRKSIHAANFVKKIGEKFENVETELLDPKDFNFPGDGNDPEGKDPRYSEITKRADAFFIVTPEYNHSFPGSLKRMLDSELGNYVHKPVAFGGASSGQWGGVRAIEALVVAVREMGLIATFSDIHFPKVQQLFNDDGLLLDPKYVSYTEKVWLELIWMAEVMKRGRDASPNS